MAAGVRGSANIMKAITWARAIVARGPSMRDTARILGPGASPNHSINQAAKCFSSSCWPRTVLVVAINVRTELDGS
jgi:hypothetical protein